MKFGKTVFVLTAFLVVQTAFAGSEVKHESSGQSDRSIKCSFDIVIGYDEKGVAQRYEVEREFSGIGSHWVTYKNLRGIISVSDFRDQPVIGINITNTVNHNWTTTPSSHSYRTGKLERPKDFSAIFVDTRSSMEISCRFID